VHSVLLLVFGTDFSDIFAPLPLNSTESFQVNIHMNLNAPVLILRSRSDNVIAEHHMDRLYEQIRQLGPQITYLSTNNQENHGISMQVSHTLYIKRSFSHCNFGQQLVDRRFPIHLYVSFKNVEKSSNLCNLLMRSIFSYFLQQVQLIYDFVLDTIVQNHGN